MEGITDNKNRTLGEVKGILGQYDGKMAGEGAVRWMFERKGSILAPLEAKTKEDMELIAIEAGADDVKIEGTNAVFYTQAADIETIKKSLEQAGLKIEAAGIAWIPKEEIEVGEKEKAKINQLLEALDENDAIQDVYSNLRA